MAVGALDVGYFSLAGQVVTSQVGSMTWTLNNQEIDISNLASGGLMERLPGQADVQCTVELTNPDADESAATSFNGLLATGSKHATTPGTGIYAIAGRSASGATGTAAAPLYSMNATCPSFNPISGDPNSVIGGGSVTFNLANTFAIAIA